MSLYERTRGHRSLNGITEGDTVYRLRGVNAYGAVVRKVDVHAQVADIRLDDGSSENNVPFAELELPDEVPEYDDGSVHETAASTDSCRIVTRILTFTLALLWVGQLISELKQAEFGTADSGLLLRLAFFVLVVILLFVSGRVLKLLNNLLLPLGIQLSVNTRATTSQGLSLPDKWFDKIAPVGTQVKNPAIVDPDPSWNYVSKHY